jgi:hypothetical protein
LPVIRQYEQKTNADGQIGGRRASRRPMQQSMSDLSRSMRATPGITRKPGNGEPGIQELDPIGGLPSSKLRRSGETIEQYLNRPK